MQYLPYLEQSGFEVRYQALLGQDYVANLATGRGYSRSAIARAYFERMALLARAPDADLIWIYAEAFPYLPASFERLAFRSGKPVVVDFDDAFFHNYDSSPRPLVRALLAGKLQPLLAGAAAACCGNEYLERYAKRFCRRTMLLPTVVDTQLYRPGSNGRGGDEVVVGWIGSPSTWSYMRPLLSVLQSLRAELPVRFRVVGAGTQAKADAFPGLDFVTWSEATEVADVQAMDIGIMPLPDEEWARGKSGYKLIQYMACGLPVVASPVGVNSTIVTDGTDGFLVTDPDAWRSALKRLIVDAALRRQFGRAARARIEADYSLQVHAPRLVGLLQSLAQPAEAARSR
ncbi:glycosyltransferase [Sphingomonas parva]|uniref:Glycosyltransferase n=1 Tax=Sphingomonas parva TaxID=2555898 RepID=A0A4Y8ZXF5_9SPHN|nr:glycosyltransferase family 4 protein [Sphingomonas parva]TFI59905.1 glycosyltransferase [Sphingomonas parva]